MIPLDTDHSGLNKFSGEDDANFRLVLPEIRRMVERGGMIVTGRYRALGKVTIGFGSKPRLIRRLSSTRACKTSTGIDCSIC